MARRPSPDCLNKLVYLRPKDTIAHRPVSLAAPTRRTKHRRRCRCILYRSHRIGDDRATRRLSMVVRSGRHGLYDYGKDLKSKNQREEDHKNGVVRKTALESALDWLAAHKAAAAGT